VRSADGGFGDGVDRWTLMAGASWSGLRVPPGDGLFSTGGGDRSLGDTGHRGVSRRFSVGDFCGAPFFPAVSDAVGSSDGIVDVFNVLCASEDDDCVGKFGLDDAAGLVSTLLFLRDRLLELVDDAREVLDLASGRAGEASRDGTGDVPMEEGFDVCDVCVVLGVCDACLELCEESFCGAEPEDGSRGRVVADGALFRDITLTSDTPAPPAAAACLLIVADQRAAWLTGQVRWEPAKTVGPGMAPCCAEGDSTEADVA
jgi:hypothetical protein